MNLEYIVYLGVAGLLGVSGAVIGVVTMRMNPKRLVKLEPLPRDRQIGLVLALIALLWCVPYTYPVVFDWMQNYLAFMAFALALCGFFFLDYLAARAIGGVFILASYVVANGAFVFYTPLGWWVSIMVWSVGIAGILLCARPCGARDYLRLTARGGWAKWAWAWYWMVLALTMLFAIVATLFGGGR